MTFKYECLFGPVSESAEIKLVRQGCKCSFNAVRLLMRTFTQTSSWGLALLAGLLPDQTNRHRKSNYAPWNP